MPDRNVVVTLSAPGVDPVRAKGIFQEFSVGHRIRRAGVVMLVGLGVAASLIPIPIIHLLGIPLALIIGVVAAIRQLSMVGRLKPLRIACPKCGERNRVGGGLGYRSTDPRERMCDSCRRALTLTIEIADPEAVAPE
ncbi:MAG TPA: hypothetical protein VGL65_01880 [Gemmatimonadales bacterium]|jgi:hypothetical protein